MLKIKIDEKEHLSQPLRVHTLLHDYKLEDVWRLPVKLSAEHTLELLIEEFGKSRDKALLKGVAGFLFKFRMFLGRVFNWDEKQTQDRLLPGSIRELYAKEEGLKFEDLPAPGSGNFIPVYKLENEFLAEIKNKTVQGAVHFSRIAIEDQVWGIHMAVYVKPRGAFGNLYMLLIKPFRLWIVYPTMMKTVKEKWELYLTLNGRKVE